MIKRGAVISCQLGHAMVPSSRLNFAAEEYIRIDCKNLRIHRFRRSTHLFDSEEPAVCSKQTIRRTAQTTPMILTHKRRQFFPIAINLIIVRGPINEILLKITTLHPQLDQRDVVPAYQLRWQRLQRFTYRCALTLTRCEIESSNEVPASKQLQYMLCQYTFYAKE